MPPESYEQYLITKPKRHEPHDEMKCACRRSAFSQLAVTGSVDVQICGPSPTRISLKILITSASNQTVGFGPNTPLDRSMQVTVSSPLILEFNRAVHGDIVMRAWYAIAVGTINVQVYEAFDEEAHPQSS